MDAIDLNDVALVRVAAGGGFTAAAAALGVPKSTVSRSLARLELALGVRLVHRTTRALALTEAGRAYYDRVRDAVLGVAEATADVVDLGKEPRGSIRVTTPLDLAQTLLAGAIARFVERYPQVRFEVSLTSRVVDLVAEGFDLALRASPLRDSSLVARKMGPANMGLFASPAYLKKRGVPRSVGDLASHELVRFRAQRGALVLETDALKERVTIDGSIEADDLLFVRQLVVAGGGIRLLPLFLPAPAAPPARAPPARGRRAGRRPAPSFPPAPRSPRHEPRRVKLFRELLLAEAKRLG